MMRPTIFVMGLLLTSVSLAATDCRVPDAPSLGADELSQRDERRLKRDTHMYLTRIERFSACVRNEFAIAKVGGASETELLSFVSEHNAVVSESKEFVAVYEAHVGPVTELANLYSRSRSPGMQPQGFAAGRPERIGPNGPPPVPGSSDWTPAGWAAYIY